MSILNLHIFGDSELVVEYIQGQFVVSHVGLIYLVKHLQALHGLFHSLSFQHVRREFNLEVDALFMQGMLLQLGALHLEEFQWGTAMNL